MKIDFEKVLANYGLKVGDTIKFDNYPYKEITIGYRDNQYFLEDKDYYYHDVLCMVNKEWHKLEPKKKFGELKCEVLYYDCSKCPLHSIRCGFCRDASLSEIWKATIKKFPDLEPMRKTIEEKLKEEVSE